MSNDPLIVPVSAQCAVFLRACLCGASLALFYDFFRILRRVFRCPAGLVAVQDLFCCAVFCLGSFLFLLSECEGKLRWFALAGQVLGAVLYWALLGEAVVRAGAWLLGLAAGALRLVLRFWVRMFRCLCGLLMRLLRLMGRLFSWPAVKIYAAAVKGGRYVQKILKKGAGKTKFCLKQHPVLLYNFRKARPNGRRLPKDRKNGRR